MDEVRDVRVGKANVLKVLRIVGVGAYLEAGALGEILLPNREMPEDLRLGEELEVFVCHDSEDRLLATTTVPIAMVGEFALLKVVGLESVGAFLDWGLDKDLFLPFAEQTRDLKLGQDVLVYIDLDKSGRISASMRWDRHTGTDVEIYKPGQKVDILVAGQSDLGFKVLINNRHQGLLFKNEVFQELRYGQRLQAFIKAVRPDGKIDVTLQEGSSQVVVDDTARKILAMLKKDGGFVALDDKTPAETIYKLFGVSKKKYKIALGGLYKQRLIRVEDDGIHLVK